MKTQEHTQVLTLEKINPSTLPELQGWKDKQLEIVKSCPFIEIKDNKTYDKAKQHRTALTYARTSITKQERILLSKIKDFRGKVSLASKELIAISLPHEQKQQEEVKRYEAKKEAEKAHKIALEKERVDTILGKINNFTNHWISEVDQLDLTSIEIFEQDFTAQTESTDGTEFQEYENEFYKKVSLVRSEFEKRKTFLITEENQRVANKKLKEERKKFELDQIKAKEEAKRLRKEEEDKHIQELKKLEAEKLKLLAERKEVEAAKQKLAKIESDRIEKEQAAAEKKRLEALQPDKEKLLLFVNTLQFSNELPDIQDSTLASWLKQTIRAIELTKHNLTTEIKNLK